MGDLGQTPKSASPAAVTSAGKGTGKGKSDNDAGGSDAQGSSTNVDRNVRQRTGGIPITTALEIATTTQYEGSVLDMRKALLDEGTGLTEALRLSFAKMTEKQSTGLTLDEVLGASSSSSLPCGMAGWFESSNSGFETGMTLSMLNRSSKTTIVYPVQLYSTFIHNAEPILNLIAAELGTHSNLSIFMSVLAQAGLRSALTEANLLGLRKYGVAFVSDQNGFVVLNAKTDSNCLSSFFPHLLKGEKRSQLRQHVLYTDLEKVESKQAARIGVTRVNVGDAGEVLKDVNFIPDDKVRRVCRVACVAYVNDPKLISDDDKALLRFVNKIETARGSVTTNSALVRFLINALASMSAILKADLPSDPADIFMKDKEATKSAEDCLGATSEFFADSKFLNP